MDLKLSYAMDNPPVAVLAACNIAGISVSMDCSLPSSCASSIVFPNGSKIEGTYVMLRCIGRLTNLYGKDVFESAQVDEWLDYIPIFYQGSQFEAGCSYVDNFLSTSTLLVGSDLSIADIALWSALSGTRQRWESLRRSKRYKNLVRWYNSLMCEYSSSLNQISGMNVGKKKSSAGIPTPLVSKDLSKVPPCGDISEKTNTPCSSLPGMDLPGAEVGKVCLRFAPEPNGFLHIGHAKAALLNKHFAEKYRGRLIVRLDDTNPSKESNEFVQSLLKDIGSLGIVCDGVTYTSDYFPRLMEMAEKLIHEGKAYVDDTPVEQMRRERDEGVESKCRNNGLSKNLELWKEMVAGSETGMKCCLRGKLDFQNPNKCLRDPVYYRCNLVPHHRVVSKYKVYPTYDFASPFVDAVEGVTHALRANEYRDRDAQYHKIQKDMGVREVCMYEFSRLNMAYTLLSKRKLLWFVQNGRVEGWDDPRLPTLQGLMRRGLKIEALAQFILEQGASTNQNLMAWDKLWSLNKRIIDPVCPRHTAVLEDRRVMISLTNGPEEPFVRTLPRHKKFIAAGNKKMYYTKNIWIDYADTLNISANDEVTLMDWGNAIINEIRRDGAGTIVKLMGTLHLEGSVKATKLKLTWLPEMEELVRLKLVEFDHLITKEKLVNTNKKKGNEVKMQEEDFLKALNPVTRKDTSALGDTNMQDLKSGEIIQLERKGYFICDVPFSSHSKPIVLFAIPDGRQRSVVQ